MWHGRKNYRRSDHTVPSHLLGGPAEQRMVPKQWLGTLIYFKVGTGWFGEPRSQKGLGAAAF